MERLLKSLKNVKNIIRKIKNGTLMFDRKRGVTLFVNMASFDHGFDVAAPPEISSEDVDILILSMIYFPKKLSLRKLLCQHLHMRHFKN